MYVAAKTLSLLLPSSLASFLCFYYPHQTRPRCVEMAIKKNKLARAFACVFSGWRSCFHQRDPWREKGWRSFVRSRGRERLKSSCRRQKVGAGKWGERGGCWVGRVSSMISCIFLSNLNKLFLYSFVYCLHQVNDGTEKFNKKMTLPTLPYSCPPSLALNLGTSRNFFAINCWLHPPLASSPPVCLQPKQA